MFHLLILFCLKLLKYLKIIKLTTNLFLFLLIFIVLITNINAELNKYNTKLSWIVGSWRSEFSGKIVWPTVPTMTYGEELSIGLAPIAKTTKAQFLNFM